MWDLGLYVGEGSLPVDDFSKFNLLENHFKPDTNYRFPFSLASGNVRRFVNQKHLDRHNDWLVYSPSKKGLYCKVCALFNVTKKAGFNNNACLGALVTTPLLDFKNLSGPNGDLYTHARNTYHGRAQENADDFKRIYLNPAIDVSNQLDSYKQKKVKENRAWMKPVVAGIILGGRNNLPLRGHRDDGLINTDGTGEGRSHEGVFRQLLKIGELCPSSHQTSTRTTWPLRRDLKSHLVSPHHSTQ